MSYREMDRDRLIALLEARDEAVEERSAAQRRLVHELEVHQTELEQQNQQLRETQALLEESRATYADLYDFAPVAYCSLEETGLIAQINLAGAALLGRERGRLIGGDLSLFVALHQRREIRNFISETLAAEGTGCKLLETTIGERLVRLLASATRDPRSGRRLVRAALLDVTAQKRAEESLRMSLRLREDFLAIVSHDLRNPLNAILLGAEMLLRAPPAEGPAREQREAERKHLEVIRQASERMNRLLSDLLDLSSMDAGHLSLEIAAHEAAGLTRTAVEILGPLALEKGIELRCDPAVGDAHARCDRERTVQVLLNLIGNALKFTSAGGRVLVAVDRRGEELVWSVRDTGMGMTQEQQERIFEPYWKADRLSRKGTGLGLSIARGLVERLGGRIWVDSAPGRGSTFFFSLAVTPRPQLRPRAGEPADPQPGMTSVIPAGSAGNTVLVVDDEEDTRETLAELLRLEGYRIATAADGREALEKLARERVFMILLDLVMPVMDGWQFLREMKERAALAAIPIVLISGQVNAAQLVQSMGLAGSIEKPFELAAVRAALHRGGRAPASLRH